MKNPEIEKELEVYYPDHLSLGQSKNDIPMGIHAADITLSDGTVVRVRECSPNKMGDKPAYYYQILN